MMKKKTIKDYCFLPFVIFFSLPLLIFAIQDGGSRSFIAYIFTLLLPFVIKKGFNIKPFHFVLISFPILILSIMYDVALFDFESYINISTWNSVFNTNIAEASELNSETRTITKVAIAFHILLYLSYLLYTKNKISPVVKPKRKKIILFFLVLIILDFASEGSTRAAFPLRSIDSFVSYFSTKKMENKYFAEKKNVTFSAKKETNTHKETIVIVLGESLRRDHLEYYGYQKPTTPLLKNEDIICFTDVVSPANQSVNSIKRMFSLAELENESPYWKMPTFIKAFKEVGYKTYWISTQRIYGENESEISFIAKETDSIVFHSPLKLDFSLVKPYQKIINNSEEKKLIFIHVMGNHAKYTRRYPKEYAYFSTTKDYRETLINQYDNSVKYNDYVLSSLLTALKKVEGESSFMMFSDHGESLFDTSDKFYAHGSVNPSKSEFNIPFILWFSDQFKANNKTKVAEIIANKDKPIIFSDFFHSIPTLYDISFDKLKKENNFFGKEYVPKTTRKVLNSSLQLLKYNNLIDTYNE